MAEKQSEDTGILPGVKPVLEALETSPESVMQVYCRKDSHKSAFRKIADLCAKHRIPLKFVDPVRLASLTAGHGAMQTQHQGVVARIAEKDFWPLEKLLVQAKDAPLPLLLALDQVQDTGNLGALARTLYALGGAGIIVPKHNSALPGPAAMRTSAGALQRLPLARETNLAVALDEAEENGFYIYGTDCRPSPAPEKGSGRESRRSLDAFTAAVMLPAIIVLGSENRGIRPVIAKRCQQFLHIPMPGDFNSLNVAQAGAILIGLCAAAHARQG